MADSAPYRLAWSRPVKVLLLAAGVAGAGALTYYLLTRSRRRETESHAVDLSITANNAPATQLDASPEEILAEDKIIGPVHILTTPNYPSHLYHAVEATARISKVRVAAATDGNFQEVEVLAQQELSAYLDAVGGFDIDGLNVLVVLGSILAIQGKFAEALNAKERALNVGVQLYGTDHPFNLEMLQTFAEVLWHLEPAPARALLDGFIKTVIKKHGANYIHLAKLYLAQASLFLLNRQLAAAENAITAARDIAVRYPGDRVADSLVVLSHIRACQYQQIQDHDPNERETYAKAEQHCQEALRVVDHGAIRPTDAIIYDVLHAHYCLFHDSGRPAEARALLPRLQRAYNHTGPLLTHSRMLRSVFARFDIVEDDSAVQAVITVGVVVQRLSPVSWAALLGGQQEGTLHLRTTLHSLEDHPVQLKEPVVSEVRTDLPDGARMHTISLRIPKGTPLQKTKYNVVIHTEAGRQLPTAVHSQLITCPKEFASTLETELS